MSREIKFRVWDYTTEKFYENGEGLTIRDLAGGFGDEVEYQQFTGLLDKKGKEIYEGDICKGLADCGPGGFIEHQFHIVYDPIKGYQWELFFWPKLEVIGNIFKNPDLIK